MPLPLPHRRAHNHKTPTAREVSRRARAAMVAARWRAQRLAANPGSVQRTSRRRGQFFERTRRRAVRSGQDADQLRPGEGLGRSRLEEAAKAHVLCGQEVAGSQAANRVIYESQSRWKAGNLRANREKEQGWNVVRACVSACAGSGRLRRALGGRMSIPVPNIGGNGDVLAFSRALLCVPAWLRRLTLGRIASSPRNYVAVRLRGVALAAWCSTVSRHARYPGFRDLAPAWPFIYFDRS